MAQGGVYGPTMRAAVLTAARQVGVVDVAVPTVKDDDVLIRVVATGICGTDIAVFLGDYPVVPPVTLGHEFAGVVVAVGSSVRDVHVDERVIGEGSWRNERAGLGTGVSRLGRSIDGCFADFVLVPRRAVHRIPDTVSFVAAQSVTTIATAIHAADRAGALDGRRVAIVGPGHAGLLLLQVVRDRGARQVAILGTRASRLDVATRLGADSVVNVREETGYRRWLGEAASGFDVVFEASGTSAGLATCMELAALGSVVVVYGIIASDLKGVAGAVFYTKELDVRGASGGDGDYESALDLVAAGRIEVEPIVTARHPLERAPWALAAVAGRKTDDIRVIFEPGAL